MKVDELIDFLDEDLGWRKKEISELVAICQKGEQEVLIKALLLIIYSHWEGFIKNASKLYLQYISESKTNLGLLTYNYKTISMKGLITECMKSKNSLTLQNELNFLKKYKDKDTVKFTISKAILSGRDKSLINTQDNLSPNVFFNICQILGLPEKTAIKTKVNYLDEFLLDNRNAISHGNKIGSNGDYEFELTVTSIMTLKNMILAIMTHFKEDLVEYVEGMYYLEEKVTEKSNYDDKSDVELSSKLKELFEEAS